MATRIADTPGPQREGSVHRGSSTPVFGTCKIGDRFNGNHHSIATLEGEIRSPLYCFKGGCTIEIQLGKGSDCHLAAACGYRTS